MDPPAKGADARQIIFVTSRWRHPRAAPRPERVADSTKVNSTMLGQLREETFDRQQKMGVVPQESSSPSGPKNSRMGRDAKDLRPVLARQMEIYAGFWSTGPPSRAAHCALQDLEILDDTLIFYILGDNGASPKHHQWHLHEMLTLNGSASLETVSSWRRTSTSLVAGSLQPLRRRLGARDEAPHISGPSSVARTGRHSKWHHRPLAQGIKAKADPLPVSPCDRRGATILERLVSRSPSW